MTPGVLPHALALPTPPRPPLLSGSLLRSVGAQLQQRAAGGGIWEDAFPRSGQQGAGRAPGAAQGPHSRHQRGARAAGAGHLLDVLPHLRAVIADHQQLQGVIHEAVLWGQEETTASGTSLVEGGFRARLFAPFWVVGAREGHPRDPTSARMMGRSSPSPSAPPPRHLLTPLTCHRSEADWASWEGWRSGRDPRASPAAGGVGLNREAPAPKPHVPFPSLGSRGALRRGVTPTRKQGYRPSPQRAPAFPPPRLQTEGLLQPPPVSASVPVPSSRGADDSPGQSGPARRAGGSGLTRPRALTMVSPPGVGEAAPTQRHD